MKPSDWFGLIVRVAGLYFVIRGVEYLMWAFIPGSDWSPSDYLMPGLAMLGIGCLVLAGADAIVSFSYGRFQDDKDDAPDRLLPTTPEEDAAQFPR